jgi:tRNA nucleotidyltransferase (CCA-adding enzyme)
VATDETRGRGDAPRLDPVRVPAGVRDVLETLHAAGAEAHLVGGCVRDLVRGAPVRDFDVTTSARPERVLALFPRAVPIGLRHGTVMVPTASGPVDVTSWRGPSLEADLALRDFTLNAMAWDPRDAELVDPAGGRADLAAGRLRPVGRAHDRFAEDPVRAVRAARLAAQLGFAVDPELGPAMTEARGALARVARERIRRELDGLFAAPHPELGIALLRRTGIEADLAPGALQDAARVVAVLPTDPSLRLAGWLRGTSAESILLRLRFPRARVREVVGLLRVHPIEGGVDPDRAADVRRLMRRAGEENLPRLFALREAELAARAGEAEAARAAERLAALRTAIARVKSGGALALRRRDLALRGDDVMRILGCRPGREVGRALAWLAERVIEDPSCNTPERLRALLEGRPAGK